MVSPRATRASNSASRLGSSVVCWDWDIVVYNNTLRPTAGSGPRRSTGDVMTQAQSLDQSSSTNGEVKVHIDDGVATVRFSHPKGNSLPAALLARLAEEIRRLGSVAEARVIV